MRSETGYWIAAVLLAVAASGLSVWFYPSLPDRIPTHWNMHGQVDAYGSKAAVFLLPGVMLLLLALFRALPWLSPRQFEIDAFRATFLFLMLTITGMLAYIHGTMLWVTLHPPLMRSRALMGGFFVFLALMGNVMSKVRRNFWIGIRTPWTLADPRVWDATHRLGGRVMVLSGVFGLTATIWGLPMSALWLFLAAMLIPIIYSLILYKRLNGAGN